MCRDRKIVSLNTSVVIPAYGTTNLLTLQELVCARGANFHFFGVFYINQTIRQSIAIDSSIPIQEQSFYHGSIQRDEAEKLLRNEGDFLMRQSTRQPYDMVLSSFNAGLPRHFMLAKTPNVRM